MIVGSFHLDPAIALWVLLPLTLVMLLVGLARHYLISWLDTRPKPISRAALREQRALMRAQLLRSKGKHLPPGEYDARREWLIEAFTEKKYLQAKAGGAEAAATNPLDPAAMDGMIGMIKKQAVSFVPQSILMGWINLFFSGFVLSKSLSVQWVCHNGACKLSKLTLPAVRYLTARLPFPLTLRFKSMMQRGVDTSDMDVTWVSSLSWYFLNLFGLNTAYGLILGGDNAADGTRDMQGVGAFGISPSKHLADALGYRALTQMNMPMPGASMPGAPAQDFSKLFNAEIENLELATPESQRWVGEDVEQRLLAFYKQSQ
jgi:hypothetical protein